MNALCEASYRIRKIAVPHTGKSALLKSYRRLRTWSFNRVKDVYYADKRIVISSEEMDTLRILTEQQKEEERAATINEYAALIKRIETLERLLAVADADFHRPQIAALREAVRHGGDKSGLLDKGDE